MSRREYRVTVRCGGGCGKNTTYYCATRAEEAEVRKRNHEHPWKCTRHDDPERNLRPGNTATRQVLVATRLKATPVRPWLDQDRWLDGLYWLPEGATTGSGFTSGPGFNAHAEDFPEGTRLVVTAEIEPGAAR
jgi:hypothetical protein